MEKFFFHPSGSMSCRSRRTQSAWKVESVSFLASSSLTIAAHALAHLARGLVGEGHRQDVGGLDPLRHEVGDARRDDARLAGARPGQDQHRTRRLQDGGTLGVVEVEEAEGTHIEAAHPEVAELQGLTLLPSHVLPAICKTARNAAEAVRVSV